MFTKVTAFALAAVAYVNCQDQFFLGQKSSNFEIYAPTESLESNTNVTSKVGDLQFKCQYQAGFNFYDLQPLAKNAPFYTFSGANNQKAVVSFCNLLSKAELLNHNCEEKDTMAVFIDSNSKCHIMSGDSITKNAQFNVDNQEDNNGLQIVYSGGEEGYDLTLNIACDEKADPLSDQSLSVTDGKSVVGNFKSKSGCKYGQLNAIWQWFTNNKWAMFAFFLIAGLIICFLGRTIFKPILFTVSCIATFGLVMLISYSTFLSNNSKAWAGWTVLAVAVILGLILGWLMLKFIRIGIFIVAAMGGYSVGILLYNAFMYKIHSQTGFWCFTIGVALVFGILSLWFFNHILIHATAILGSFMAVYGIGLVAGRYTNPFTIAELYQQGLLDNVDPVFYAYLAGNLVLYVMGMLYQYRVKNGDTSGESHYHIRDDYGRKYGRRY